MRKVTVKPHIMRNTRHHLNKLYKELGFNKADSYSPIGSDKAYTSTPCYYCGEPATIREHAYPISALQADIDVGNPINRSRLKLVPGCYECNSILGKKVFTSLAERREYVQKRLLKKYAKLIPVSYWTFSELMELEPTFREYVIRGMEAYCILYKRVHYRG